VFRRAAPECWPRIISMSSQYLSPVNVSYHYIAGKFRNSLWPSQLIENMILLLSFPEF
jgi:hypothetical protein